MSSFDPDGAQPRAKRAKRTYSKRGNNSGGSSSSRDRTPRLASSRQSAFSRIADLSSLRDRSTHELSERLERDGYSAEEAREAIGRAVECGIVDDMRFADAFVRGRVSAGKGELVIRRDLKQHGIELDDLPGWPEEYGMTPSEQCERAVRCLAGHAPTGKDPYASARRRLESRGYSPSVAHQAANAWLEEWRNTDI